MKIVLRNSKVVYEELQWTKVTKSSTTQRTITLGQASDFTEFTHMKVKFTVKSTGSTVVNPIPNVWLGVGEGTNDAVAYFLGDVVTNVNFTIETAVDMEFAFTLSAAIATDKNLKFGIAGTVNENFALMTYVYDLEYIFY